MNKKQLLSSLCCLLMAAGAPAQEKLFDAAKTASPVKNGDGSVTVNLFAPQARRVTVSGDLVQNAEGRADLHRDDNGLWSYTTQPLDPELYSYTFNVDGVTMTDPANVYQNRDIATYSSIVIVSRAEGDRGSLYSVNEVPHGNLAKVWYASPTLGMQRRMTVYTPAGYDQGRDYPVMYLLHGAGGDENAWSELGRAAQIMDNLIARGKARPMIVVMTNGNPNCQAAPGEWSAGMYVPSFMGDTGAKEPAKASMEASFMDVVRFVDSHYKTRPSREARAVCGLSMGGGHTFGISRLYPGEFDYYGLFSAGLHLGGGLADIQPGASFYDRLKANAEARQQLRRLFDSRPKLYWIAIGKTDFLYQNNADLRRFLDEQHYPYEYRETDGGHIWRNWRIYLTEFAQKIFR